jgi:hypothetical protein
MKPDAKRCTEDSEKPEFLKAAEAQAKRVGLAPAELLRRDRQKVRESDYPTADCLDPHEVEAAIADSLDAMSADRQAHVEQCSACASLLALAIPDLAKLEENLQLVRRFAKSLPAQPEPLSADDWRESFRPIAILRPAANA